MTMSNQVNTRLRVACLVAEHWHNVLGALLDHNAPVSTDYAFFIVTRIEAALEGETDPASLGLDDQSTLALRQILDASLARRRS